MLYCLKSGFIHELEEAMNAVPIVLQRFVVFVAGNHRFMFQIADKALAVIQHDRYAVRTVTRRRDDFSFDPDAFQEGTASFATDDRDL